MAKACGSLFLLAIGDGASPTEVFTVIGSFRTNGLAGSAEAIDVTDKTSAADREILANCGVKSYTMSGDGVSTDEATLKQMELAFQDQDIVNYEIESGLGDKYTGPFKITAFERSGAYNDAETFTATLESAAALTYTPITP